MSAAIAFQPSTYVTFSNIVATCDFPMLRKQIGFGLAKMTAWAALSEFSTGLHRKRRFHWRTALCAVVRADQVPETRSGRFDFLF